MNKTYVCVYRDGVDDPFIYTGDIRRITDVLDKLHGGHLNTLDPRYCTSNMTDIRCLYAEISWRDSIGSDFIIEATEAPALGEKLFHITGEQVSQG